MYADLDDIPSALLIRELARRELAVILGHCPYCNQDVTAHTCKYAGRVADYHAEGMSVAGCPICQARKQGDTR